MSVVATPRTRAAALLGFAARRLLRIVVSVWGIVTFTFLLIRLVPGDPVRAALGVQATPELVEAKRETLGLTGPLVVQYLRYLWNLVRGELGNSLLTDQPVSQAISQRLGHTLELALTAFVLVVVIAVPLGLVMAVLTQRGRRRRLELGFTTGAIVITGIPEYLLGVVLVYLFAVRTHLLPVAGADSLSSFVLPTIALAMGSAAALARVLRVELLGSLGADFVRTARSKRLRPWLIYVRHALPNAMTNTLTLAGLTLGWIIAGTVLVETVFAWPGLGPAVVDSIRNKDYPLVQGIALVYGLLILVINLIVDIALALLDPRLAVEES